MENISKSRQIRQFIRSRLDLISDDAFSTQSESLLIRDGVYCGHRFRQAGYEAVWFVEEGQVKFYTASGELVESVSIDAIGTRALPQAA
jgi:hypothetical protein